MYTFPDESTATLVGLNNSALVGDPMSPLYPGVPFPAIVVMVPLEIFRTRWFTESQT